MTASNTSNALKNISGTIALAGAGKMGGAMLAGWLAGGLDARRVVVIEPQPSGRSARSPPKAFASIRRTPARSGRWWWRSSRNRSARPAPTLKPLVGASTLVVSIMAGTTIASLEAVCGGMVVRAMPNTPASIGRGITVAVAARTVSAEQRATADALLARPARWNGSRMKA